MSLVLVRTFLTIVRTGSLIAASRALNVTQSTVTARLKSLEEELGQALLHRRKTGVALTPAGLAFRRYAEAMSAMWQQALQEVAAPPGASPPCRLGCDPDLWPSLGRALVARVRRERPATALSVRRGDGARLDEWLELGLIDAALSYRPSAGDGIVVHPLEPETLALFGTRRDAPVRGDPDYVYVDAGSEFGRAHVAAYTDAGVARHAFDSAAWALEHLLDHGGSAYLAEALAAPHVVSGALHRLEPAATFRRSVYLLASETIGESGAWLPEMARAGPGPA